MISNLTVQSPEAFLRQQRFPVWFFTNEEIAHVWRDLPEFPNARILGVAGAGDWALNLASQGAGQSFQLVDNRPLALLTVELKLALIRHHDKESFLQMFHERELRTADVLASVANMLSEPSLSVFTKLAQNHRRWNDLMRDRKLWYRESWRALRRDDYLAYLRLDSAYMQARRVGDTMTLEHCLLESLLARSDAASFGLIFLSNLLDSIRYVPYPSELIAEASRKLVERGLLVCLTQHAPAILQILAERAGFRLVFLEHHPFRFFSALAGAYHYSVLAFQI